MKLNEVFRIVEEEEEEADKDVNKDANKDFGKDADNHGTRIDKAIKLMFKSPIVRDMNEHELIQLAIVILDHAGVDDVVQQKFKQLLGVVGKTPR